MAGKFGVYDPSESGSKTFNPITRKWEYGQHGLKYNPNGDEGIYSTKKGKEVDEIRKENNSGRTR